MEILLIGNGFDLEHELPASYGDFLEFCERTRRIYTFSEKTYKSKYRRENIDNWQMNDSVKDMLLDAFDKRKFNKILQKDGTFITEVVTPNKLLNELYSHIYNNTWLNYFLECSSYMGENWIDFETEISKVIQALDAARFQIECGGTATNVEENER